MSRRTSADAFADAAAAMVDDVHVGDILARLLADCAEVVGAQAVAILVTEGPDRLALLSSTSAVASDLEMLQVQDEQGPALCVDAVRTGEIVSGTTEDMVPRWAHVGATIVAAGFGSVEAYPLTWRGRVLGGLNVFRESRHERSPSVDALTQAFSDVATIALLHSSDIPADQVTARVHEAVMARSTIEQAKGVLSELEGVDMEGASRRLHELATAEGAPLTEVAVRVLARAQRARS